MSMLSTYEGGVGVGTSCTSASLEVFTHNVGNPNSESWQRKFIGRPSLDGVDTMANKTWPDGPDGAVSINSHVHNGIITPHVNCTAVLVNFTEIRDPEVLVITRLKELVPAKDATTKPNVKSYAGRINQMLKLVDENEGGQVLRGLNLRKITQQDLRNEIVGCLNMYVFLRTDKTKNSNKMLCVFDAMKLWTLDNRFTTASVKAKWMASKERLFFEEFLTLLNPWHGLICGLLQIPSIGVLDHHECDHRGPLMRALPPMVQPLSMEGDSSISHVTEEVIKEEGDPCDEDPYSQQTSTLASMQGQNAELGARPRRVEFELAELKLEGERKDIALADKTAQIEKMKQAAASTIVEGEDVADEVHTEEIQADEIGADEFPVPVLTPTAPDAGLSTASSEEAPQEHERRGPEEPEPEPEPKPMPEPDEKANATPGKEVQPEPDTAVEPEQQVEAVDEPGPALADKTGQKKKKKKKKKKKTNAKWWHQR